MNFFKRIFKSEPKLDPLDLSVMKTDLHSHLIPGIDDGSKSLEESIALIKRFKELGYSKVITTPHVMSDFYRNTPEIILSGLAEVRNAIEQEGIEIEIEAAAEYYLDDYFEELIKQNNLLTFGENHVLFELSFQSPPTRIKEAIFALITGGYKPILAHVERYPFYFNEWDTLEDLRNRGAIFQLNINSLSGQYGPQVKKMGQDLIDRDWVEVIGSDCHHMRHLDSINELRTNPYLHKISEKSELLNKFF